MVRLFVWAGMAALVKGFVDKKDESKFAAYQRDVTIVGGMTNRAKNPIPMTARVVSMMDIASGKEKLSNLSNFAAGPGSFYNEFLKDKSQDKM